MSGAPGSNTAAIDLIILGIAGIIAGLFLAGVGFAFAWVSFQ